MEQPCGPRQALICCVRSALATPARMGGGGVAHGDGVNSLPVAIRLHPVSGTLLAETRNRSTGISGTLRWTPLIELANLEKNSETVRLRRYFEVGRNMAIIFKTRTHWAAKASKSITFWANFQEAASVTGDCR